MAGSVAAIILFILLTYGVSFGSIALFCILDDLLLGWEFDFIYQNSALLASNSDTNRFMLN